MPCTNPDVARGDARWAWLMQREPTRGVPGCVLLDCPGVVTCAVCRPSIRQVLKQTCRAAIAVVMLSVLVPSVHAIACADIPLDDGCLFTITGSDTPDPDDGFAVTNAYGVPMWDFVKTRDLEALGYPISQRWVDGPFTLQAFQKVILQWDPSEGRMNYYNTLDVLANRYPEVELPFVPAHQVLDEDRGADFRTVTRNHLALLDHNAAIKRRFLAEADWLNLYGLPIRYEEREVDGNPQGVQLLRTQRTVFVIWNVPAPGTTIGRVQLQNLPDQVKKLGDVIIPDWVKHPTTEVNPELAEAVQSLSWASGDVSPLQQDVLLRWATIARSSPALFRRLMDESEIGEIVRNEPTPSTPRILAPLITVARLPWMHDGINVNELDSVDRIIRSAGKGPAYVEALLQKAWLARDLNRNETRLIRSLEQEMTRLSPSTSSKQQSDRVDRIFRKILSMPMMDRIDGLETSTLRYIIRRYAHRHMLEQRLDSAISSLEGVVNYLESRGGLTDIHAALIVYTGLNRVPPDGLMQPPYSFVPARPEHLDIYLDPHYTNNFGINIEQRTISLPNSGHLDLLIAKSDGFFDISMDTLEESVRIVHRIMDTTFPLSGIAVLAGTDRGSSAAGNFINIFTGTYGLDGEYKWEHKQSELIHEIAHAYWGSGAGWVVEGGATFVQFASGAQPSQSLEKLGENCGYDKIVHSARTVPPRPPACDYFLGASLFLDLQRSLSADVFREAFARFFALIRDGYPASYYGEIHGATYTYTSEAMERKSRRSLDYLIQAFVAEVDLESAAISRRVFGRWFFL